MRALGVSKAGRAIEVALSGITSFTAWAGRDSTEFAPGQTFRGVDLADELDRRTTTLATGARLGLVAGGDLRYTLLGVTAFDVRVTRDVVYSFDQFKP